MKNILIVDDTPQELILLQTLLNRHGYGVTTATNGAEALEKARSERPDMIISDILMPIMDGFTLCREWKRDDRLKDVPFVFFTATYTDPTDEKFALGLSAERFIVKPQDQQVLLGIIEDVFSEDKNILVGSQGAVQGGVEELKYGGHGKERIRDKGIGGELGIEFRLKNL